MIVRRFTNLLLMACLLACGFVSLPPANASAPKASDCDASFATLKAASQLNKLSAAPVPSEFRALDVLGHPTIAINQETGSIEWMTPRARAMLESHFGELQDPARMPSDTDSWLARALPEPASSAQGHLANPIFRQPNGHDEVQLQVRGRLPEDGLVLVGVKEFSLSKLLVDIERKYGLTPKESEVFYWVAQGKTNPDIGTILGSSRDTVRKHIENIYRKLGLSNRTQPSQMLSRDFPENIGN